MMHHGHRSRLILREQAEEAAGLQVLVPTVPPAPVSTWPRDFLLWGSVSPSLTWDELDHIDHGP